MIRNLMKESEEKNNMEDSVKRDRIRKITGIYYSNPKVQEAILKFAKDREVVPRYFDGFGRRPDGLQYLSDVNGLVKKGATSFHASEEIWMDPMQINSEWNIKEANAARKGWDLVIDIDSKYLDLSKALCILICNALEKHGIGNYGIKFSGSKGWHIIVSGNAFPDVFEEERKNEMFPEWPRAICEYLMSYVKKDYNKVASKVMGSVEKVKGRTGLSEEDFMESLCPNCGRKVNKGKLVKLKCGDCGFSIQRKDMKITKRQLMCPQDNCVGGLEIVDEKDYFECGKCDNVSSIDKRESSGKYNVTFERSAVEGKEFSEEVSGAKFGDSDLVLVAPRHLFRMPYSLHEKTALASVVIRKDEVEKFDPHKDANPLNVNIREFMPENKGGEGEKLLRKALEWRKENKVEEKFDKGKYKEYKEIDVKNITEEMFPKPIKKLLKGLSEGRKRGLFVVLTFLRTLNFSPEEINRRVREWNEKNEPPLKEGYIRSQIDWHLKQRKKILPPNYSNDNFYADLGLLDEKPRAKNPIVEVMRASYSKSNLKKKGIN
jgi:DNA primase catalytic subunit